MRGLVELWLVKLILLVRPDLAPLAQGDDPAPLAWWLLTSGRDEYAAVRENEEIRRFLNEPAGPGQPSRLERLVYDRREDVRAVHAFGSPGYRDWFVRHGIAEHGLGAFVGVPGAPPQVDPRSRPFGVNVVGHAFGELGVGEEARMAARSLMAAGVPFTLVNVPTGVTASEGDRSVSEFVSDEGPYGFNLLCMTPLETVRWYLERGTRQWAGRFTIGQWWWELAKWPQEWLPAFRLVDEIWAPTRYILDGVSKVSPVHCEYMPSAVELPPVSKRTRADFGLPEHAYLFCCSFDLNSGVVRKNPGAVLEAFERAFPDRSANAAKVGLVLKCQRPTHAEPLWDSVKAAASGDSRIHILEATVPKADLLALYRACDCYVSLHRAEGFGRNLAEAMLLGKPVVATAYSGNLDFCDQSECELVPYRLVPVRSGEYLQSKGVAWADPDVESAARIMARLAANGRKNCWSRSLVARSASTVGSAYRVRLQRILG
jgi:glycosyltransferase involved in cell wall biosynthesis